ncbi:hypothetical protein BvCmsSIP077_01576 [Escherichia coli]|nr:hypothetical protein BvCmsSIP077_01576 [Escherichia coli]GEG10073.1 hypothetical protein EC150222_02388 [Escherichia coli O145:H28]GEG38165.1 hypothetical protein EC160018_03559 [Escherichia coli O145:H28]
MLLLYVMKCLIFSGIMGIIKKVVCGHRIIQLLINIQRAKRMKFHMTNISVLQLN